MIVIFAKLDRGAAVEKERAIGIAARRRENIFMGCGV